MRKAAGMLRAVGVALLAMACQSAPEPTSPGSPPPPSPPTPSAAATAPGAIDGKVDIGGFALYLKCIGAGSPTVLIEAGLGGKSNHWTDVHEAVATTTRTCAYNRANLFPSDDRPGSANGENLASVGIMADELARLVDAAGIEGPIVLAGHSYGGMIIRVFASRHPEDVEGLVLLDSSSVGQFESNSFGDEPLREEPTTIDQQASIVELHAAEDFGDTPIAVVTQGQLNGEYEPLWAGYQDALAAQSTNSLHVVAKDAGHLLNIDAPDLVVAVIDEVVTAARTGSRLPGCGPELEQVGAECLGSTMTAQIEAWNELRNAVTPAPGDLPDGTYTVTLTREDYKAIAGTDVEQERDDFTWSLDGGHWSLQVETDGVVTATRDVYAVAGDTLTIRIPPDWKIPRTPGVNVLTWSVGDDGTLRFEQTDGYAVEPVFAKPWTRLSAEEIPPQD